VTCVYNNAIQYFMTIERA